MTSPRLPKRRREGAPRAAARGRLTRGPWAIGIIVVVALVAVGVVIGISVATQGGSDSEKLLEISVPGRSLGQDTAPVTILEVSDYQCPFCKRFVDTTEGEIKKEYIETGKVRLEFRNMAFLGEESVLAAEAAECANDQGRFWDYHDKLFAEQRGENEGWFAPGNLKEFASDLELDREAFDACLDSHKYRELIVKEREAAQDAGVKGTPSFFINDEFVRGYLSFEDFRQLIEDALAEAEREATPEASEPTPSTQEGGS